MKYLFLLYADESTFPPPESPEAQAVFAQYGAFFEHVDGRGIFQAGDPVQGSASATTVAVRDGRTDATEGPAKPGGEQIIGFYVLDVDSDEDAVDLASRIPASQVGRVEARPIRVM